MLMFVSRDQNSQVKKGFELCTNSSTTFLVNVGHLPFLTQVTTRQVINNAAGGGGRMDNKSILFHGSPSLPVAIVCAFMQCLRGADVLNVDYATVSAAAALFSGQSECITSRIWAWNNIPDLPNGLGNARTWKKSYKPMRNPSLICVIRYLS